MKSSKEIKADIESLDDDDNDWKFFSKEMQLKRATLSEDFKNNILPLFKPLVKECEEKAPESFFITLNTGQKFIYYCSKARLVPVYEKGKKGKSKYVPPHSFLKYFSFVLNSEQISQRSVANTLNQGDSPDQQISNQESITINENPFAGTKPLGGKEMEIMNKTFSRLMKEGKNENQKEGDEVEQGNRLIGSFMGIHKAEDEEFREHWQFPKGLSPNEYRTYTLDAAELKYHTSFDWLMPVVEKIESLPEPFNVSIMKYGCSIAYVHFFDGKTIVDVSTEGKTKILATWEAVIIFIQWYNESLKQKQK